MRSRARQFVCVKDRDIGWESTKPKANYRTSFICFSFTCHSTEFRTCLWLSISFPTAKEKSPYYGVKAIGSPLKLDPLLLISSTWLSFLLGLRMKQTRLSLCCCHTSLWIEQRAEWRAATCFAPSIPRNSLGDCPTDNLLWARSLWFNFCGLVFCAAGVNNTFLLCLHPPEMLHAGGFFYSICESFQTCDQVRGKSLLRLLPCLKIILQQLWHYLCSYSKSPISLRVWYFELLLFLKVFL